MTIAGQVLYFSLQIMASGFATYPEGKCEKSGLITGIELERTSMLFGGVTIAHVISVLLQSDHVSLLVDT